MRRAALVAGAGIAVFASQAIWVTYSPVATLVAEELGVSGEAVGLLAILYPAFFLVLTIPSGVLLDRNPGVWLAVGALLTAAGGVLRLLEPRSYYWLLACQALAAAGQPFLLNSFALIASRVYPDARGTVVSILSFSMYLGIIYALGAGRTIYSLAGLEALNTAPAVTAALGAILLIGSSSLLRTEGQLGGRGVAELKAAVKDLVAVARRRDLWLLGALLGLGVAIFDNMSIWLETALAPAGLGGVAGISVAAALLAGLVGVATIPAWVATIGARTLYIRVATLAVTASFMLLALTTSRTTVLVLIPLSGLIMLPAYPLIMEWISTFHEKEVQGRATGFIGLVSRLFTVVLAAAATFFIESPAEYFAYLTLLGVAAAIIAFKLPGGR